MHASDLIPKNSESYFIFEGPFDYFLSRICGYRLYQRWINDVLEKKPKSPRITPSVTAKFLLNFFWEYSKFWEYSSTVV